MDFPPDDYDEEDESEDDYNLLEVSSDVAVDPREYGDDISEDDEGYATVHPFFPAMEVTDNDEAALKKSMMLKARERLLLPEKNMLATRMWLATSR